MKLYSTLTDDELVRMYEEGKDNAFDILLKRHQVKLFEYIFFLTRNEDFANDIFQDTFVRAITAIRSHNYEATGNFCSWLICISRNLILDNHRRQHNTTMVSHELVDENGDVKGDLLNDIRLCEPTIEQDVFKQESMEKVRQMVDRLPDNQREIIYLRYYNDMPFKDIAKILNISINTALGRVRYAIINLRKMMNEHNISLTA